MVIGRTSSSILGTRGGHVARPLPAAARSPVWGLRDRGAFTFTFLTGPRLGAVVTPPADSLPPRGPPHTPRARAHKPTSAPANRPSRPPVPACTPAESQPS